MKLPFKLLLFLLPFSMNAQNTETIKLIELRNYILQPGQWEKFDAFLGSNIFPRQKALGAHILNRFKLKDSVDNYVWIRGFADMHARSKFLKDFYYSAYWKSQAAETNSMLIDSYNVTLLKPVDSISGVRVSEFTKWKGVVVVDFYETKEERDKLVDRLVKGGIDKTSIWVCELGFNDYPYQHVYQDKNLVVVIRNYREEAERIGKIAQINLKPRTQILYPYK